MSSSSTYEEITMIKGREEMASVEKTNSGESMGGGRLLKKGPWTTAEDAILIDYVRKHGEGNWNDVQKHSGLFRCGKSCRLRWANHLRPDLKKGSITPEEEQRIIELHAKMGNKWARMTAELPGRTDNEIKNYWNTRIKRLQRAGLPIYPPDVCMQVLNESQENQSMDILSSGNQHNDLSRADSFEIPQAEFKRLEVDNVLHYKLPLIDIPACNILTQGVGTSRNYGFILPPMCASKLHWESDTPFPHQGDGGSRPLPSLGLSSPYGTGSDPNTNGQFPFGVFGSHAFINGNTSSEPLSGAKLELPSLQYASPREGDWCTPASSLPSLESVDNLIQFPAADEPADFNCVSPRSSGLLEAVLYESHTRKRSRESSCEHHTDASVHPIDVMDSSSLNQREWTAQGDPNSPLGHSAASVFSEYTPIKVSSSDEPQTVESMLDWDKQNAARLTSTQYDGKKQKVKQTELLRPDALLNSGWFVHNEYKKEHALLEYAIGALLNVDVNSI